MTTDYKMKFVQCLEPVLSSLSGAEYSSSQASCRQEPGEQAPTAPAATPSTSSYRSVSKSLPATPKHRSSARVEFQTDFPEHCKMFDGHMKVGGRLGASSRHNLTFHEVKRTSIRKFVPLASSDQILVKLFFADFVVVFNCFFVF